MMLIKKYSILIHLLFEKRDRMNLPKNRKRKSLHKMKSSQKATMQLFNYFQTSTSETGTNCINTTVTN